MGNETFCNFSALYMRGAGSAFRKGGTFEKQKVGYVEGKTKKWPICLSTLRFTRNRTNSKENVVIFANVVWKNPTAILAVTPCKLRSLFCVRNKWHLIKEHKEHKQNLCQEWRRKTREERKKDEENQSKSIESNGGASSCCRSRDLTPSWWYTAFQIRTTHAIYKTEKKNDEQWIIS
jgi:hypothetical protein